ncbi:hypothetical protein D3C71_1916710 [compost metagenome]
MPIPSAAKISSACPAGMLMASPMEAPMNGAVQGEAMATASTPLRNALVSGLLACLPARLLGTKWPNSNRPARLRPITVNRVASSATTRGDCS